MMGLMNVSTNSMNKMLFTLKFSLMLSVFFMTLLKWCSNGVKLKFCSHMCIRKNIIWIFCGNYVSSLQGSGDILFFPLRLSVGLSVRHKNVSAL